MKLRALIACQTCFQVLIDEKVDIAVYKVISTTQYLVMTFEIQSSAMVVSTLRKATYFSANIISLIKI